jgi:hypothetical protein
VLSLTAVDSPGEHDRINLASFYPLLAIIMDTHCLHEQRPHHRALSHKIVSAPNFRDSTDGIREFPDGSGVLGRIITLGGPIHRDTALAHPEEWWPFAPDDTARHKLTHRSSYPPSRHSRYLDVGNVRHNLHFHQREMQRYGEKTPHLIEILQ